MQFNPGEDQTHLSWSDPQWMAFYPLDATTVLDYFALSTFYDRTCNNEIAKQRRLPPTDLWKLPPGIEYVLQTAQPPHLFIIRKQLRQGPEVTQPQALYYVLDGVVYQCPSLHAVLESRLLRAFFYIKGAFQQLQADLDPGQRADKLESQLKEQDDEPMVVMKKLTDEEQEFNTKINNILYTAFNKAHQMPEIVAAPPPQLPEPQAEPQAEEEIKQEVKKEETVDNKSNKTKNTSNKKGKS
eukprot:TRINITY_DN3260_c0_g1_i1.p2 TRINITY_DN3260_c0_g1~~TRINITY_DN3260_c0_g1_i1.p2  ORF type:complete len:241 (+),score=45.76 TRINITY_DN3260_c0_g1_i1:338-1060(+)